VKRRARPASPHVSGRRDGTGTALLYECQPKSIEELLQQLLFIGGEVPGSFLLQDSEQIDEMAGLVQIRRRSTRRGVDRRRLSQSGRSSKRSKRRSSEAID
jgi:hypothetical protein